MVRPTGITIQKNAVIKIHATEVNGKTIIQSHDTGSILTKTFDTQEAALVWARRLYKVDNLELEITKLGGQQ